jgi:beta-lactamase regulating signal transducer with metallopeptidase domain
MRLYCVWVLTPVTKMLKFATTHHKNVTVSSGVSTKICDKNVSLKAEKEKVYSEN